ncbi:hypothetical protein PGT21_027998 [Puccinia graminis f. sp. tritici]|uniref:Uncharacterized protein n=1 Tax=Puccinia graminis f. sp. tritici TaxID=56615 RepID=A0A5B0NK81_PUCGR|nr:hypothetical protein PGT21_027998 [Puccinia graminis f. sp. tritici]
MESGPTSNLMPASMGHISLKVSPTRGRRNIARLSIMRPLRLNISSQTRPPDGQQDKLAGVRAIRPPGPTVSIRPASLLYRAPTALHGTASHLLRHILRESSPAPSPTTKPPPGSPVKFLSLPTSRGARQPYGPLFQNDAILDGFLLNNGGYLDDSDSESEAEDPSDCDTPNQSVLNLTKKSAEGPQSRSLFKASIEYF